MYTGAIWQFGARFAPFLCGGMKKADLVDAMENWEAEALRGLMSWH